MTKFSAKLRIINKLRDTDLCYHFTKDEKNRLGAVLLRKNWGRICRFNLCEIQC